MGNKQHRIASLSSVIKSSTQKLQCLWPGCILHSYSICRRSLHCRIKLIRVLRSEIGYTEKKGFTKNMSHWAELRNTWLTSEVKGMHTEPSHQEKKNNPVVGEQKQCSGKPDWQWDSPGPAPPKLCYSSFNTAITFRLTPKSQDSISKMPLY